MTPRERQRWRATMAAVGDTGAPSPAAAISPGQLPLSLPGRSLTPRQWDVLDAFARTGRRSLAAAELGITENTAREHLRQAYARLGVRGAVQAIRVMGDRP